MSRTLSLTLRAAMNAPETGEIVAALVTVAHDDLVTPMRFSSDPTARLSTDPLRYGTVSRGLTFEFLPMAIQLPDDVEQKPPAMRLVLSNIDRETIALLRSTAKPASVTVELVLAAAPDFVEVSYPPFDLVEANYNQESITLTLAIDALVSEPFPAGSFTPAGFPGLF